MKRFCFVQLVVVAIVAVLLPVSAITIAAQQPQTGSVPKLPLEVVPDFLKYSSDMNLGEVLAVAVNSKGRVMVLNHPGTATSGPLYGNATTQLWEFDHTGKFVREWGKGVYGLGYGHAVRYDQHDNLWVVDKGTNSVMKFNPAGYVVMNLGRRPEGYEEHRHWDFSKGPPRHRDGYFDGPTDVAWDADDNIYVSDGYVNSQVAKFDKHGNFLKSWGSRGNGTGQFMTPHNIAVDRQGRVYVADRGNRRIQVFDSEGTFQRMIMLNAPYDKTRRPALGNLAANPPDETAPWTLCISNTPTQHLFATDQEPGRLYKMTLDGKILGTWGESGRQVGQLNWAHGLACATEETIYIADMNNWRVQKLVTRAGTRTSQRE